MLNFNKLLLGSAGVIALAAFHANASPITDLYNTGVDNSGAVLPYGSVDPHYVIGQNNPDSPGNFLPELTMDSSGGFPIPPWLGDDNLSRWDSESTDGHGNEGVGTFNNQTTFTTDFTGLLTIHGQWATDNEAYGIYLNDVPVNSGNNNEFGTWTPFTIDVAVTPGTQTLVFQTHNDGGPGGVRVEFTSISPEPASLSLLGFGALGLLARRRKA